MATSFESNQEATMASCPIDARKADLPSTNPELYFSCKAAVPLTASESIAFFSFFETEKSVTQQKLQTQCFEKGESIKDYVSVRIGRNQSTDTLNHFLIAMELKSHKKPNQFLAHYFSVYEIDSEGDLTEFDKNHPWNGALAIEELSYSNSLRVLYRSLCDELSSDLHQLNAFGKRIFDFYGPHVKVKTCYQGHEFFARYHSKDYVRSFLEGPDVKCMIADELLKEKEDVVVAQITSEISSIVISQHEQNDQAEETTNEVEGLGCSAMNEASSSLEICPEAPLTYPFPKQLNYEPYDVLLLRKIAAETFKDMDIFQEMIVGNGSLFGRESYREAVEFRQKRLSELREEPRCSDTDMRIAFYTDCFEEPLEAEAILVCRFLKWIDPDRVTAYEKVYLDAMLVANSIDEETADGLGGDQGIESNQAKVASKQKKQKKRNGKANKKGKKK